MNRLRLFNFGRNRGMWNQLLRLTGRRSNNNTIWTILGLGIAGVAVFSMRKGRNAQYVMAKPIQRAKSGINNLMNQQMRTPSLATIEFSKEIAAKPTSIPTNRSHYQQSK
jgi:hypothetical protein